MRFASFHIMGTAGSVEPKQRYDDAIEQIVLAEELGFTTAWFAEHHFSNYGYSVNPLMLGVKAAAHTTKIRLGQAVLVTPLWHPLRLAEDIALADVLSNGRIEVGMGRGYQPMEFKGMSVSLEESRTIFPEQLEILRLAWTRQDFTFEGTHFKVPIPVTILPRPLQQPHPPIWLGATSPQTLDWAAEQGADILLAGGPTSTAQIAEWHKRILEKRTAAGHRGPLRYGILRQVFVTETEQEARAAIGQARWQRRLAFQLRQGAQAIGGRIADMPFEGELNDEQIWDQLFYGTPDQVIEKIRGQQATGMTDFLSWFDIGGLPNEAVLRSMRLFAREVMPAFADR